MTNYCPACGAEIEDKGYGNTYCCSRDCHQFMLDTFEQECLEDYITEATKTFLEGDKECSELS